MLGRQEAESLLKRALHFSKADETEASLTFQDASLTRFANNAIHQNVAETNVTLTIKAVVGRRFGTAVTNNLSDESLAKTAERALLHAQKQPEDPDFPGLPSPQPVSSVDAFDDATAAFSPKARAQGVRAICQQAKANKLNAFGAFQITANETAIANSRGLMVYHPGTTADLQTVVAGEDGTGRAHLSSWQVHEIDAEHIGQEAVDGAKRAQNPRAIEPGEYTIVAEPYVAEDMITWLNFAGMSAQDVQEGQSWMNGRISKQAMSPLVSIWDDGCDLDGAPLPFDYEGMPRKRVQIVENGIIRGPVYDRYTAGKEGKQTTGHAIPPSFLFFRGPLAVNLFMAGGDSSVAAMVASTKKGLYVNRFWYTRLVHPRDCVITGMTRDGLFMIEDGQITYPVKNLRFTQSYVEALAHVQAISRERRTLINEYLGTTCVPALKIERFNFTGSTV
jgi:predicted Zn-dependent protease